MGGARPLPIELEESRRKQSAISLREEKPKGGGPPVTYLSGSETFNLPVRSREQMHALLAQAPPPAPTYLRASRRELAFELAGSSDPRAACSARRATPRARSAAPRATSSRRARTP